MKKAYSVFITALCAFLLGYIFLAPKNDAATSGTRAAAAAPTPRATVFTYTNPPYQSRYSSSYYSSPTSNPSASGTSTKQTQKTYILNTNTKKFHLPSCGSVKQMAERNKKTFSGTRDEVINMGYSPCKKSYP